jgi:hypothetical protein
MRANLSGPSPTLLGYSVDVFAADTPTDDVLL